MYFRNERELTPGIFTFAYKFIWQVAYFSTTGLTFIVSDVFPCSEALPCSTVATPHIGPR